MAALLCRLARNYLDAFVKKRDTDDALDLLRKNQIPATTTARSPTFEPVGKLDARGIKAVYGFYESQGLIHGSVDVTAMVDVSAMARAAQKLGAYRDARLLAPGYDQVAKLESAGFLEWHREYATVPESDDLGPNQVAL